VIATSDVPLWGALLIGLAGGVLGALFTIRRERGAEFRTRMLHAADDFLEALTASSRHVVDVRNMLANEKRPDSEVDAALRRVEVARDEVLSNLARIDLLFGRETPTWTSATSAFQAIEDAIDSLRAVRAGDNRAARLLDADGDAFEASVSAFGAAVRSDARGTSPRLRHWIRRVRADLERSTTRLNRWLHQLRYRLAR
jgi:hypothetical protein